VKFNIESLDWVSRSEAMKAAFGSGSEMLTPKACLQMDDWGTEDLDHEHGTGQGSDLDGLILVVMSPEGGSEGGLWMSAKRETTWILQRLVLAMITSKE